MKDQKQNNRSMLRGAVTLVGAAALYEGLARSGIFAAALLPTIPTILRALIVMLRDGTMEMHAVYTLYRVLFGFFLAVVFSLPHGILMARFKRVEDFFLRW